MDTSHSHRSLARHSPARIQPSTSLKQNFHIPSMVKPADAHRSFGERTVDAPVGHMGKKFGPTCRGDIAPNTWWVAMIPQAEWAGGRLPLLSCGTTLIVGTPRLCSGRRAQLNHHFICHPILKLHTPELFLWCHVQFQSSGCTHTCGKRFW